MLRYLTTEEFVFLCGVLTTIVAATVFLDFRSRRTRLAIWWAVMLAGVAGIGLTMYKRLPHSNLAHYYLGAKYAIDYPDFYQVITAAQGEPQIGYRNLDDPNHLVRTDPRAQRLYYIDLLKRYNVAFAPDASRETLEKRVVAQGLFQREADDILKTTLGSDGAESLKRDVSYPSIFTDDFGFNGSPLVVLVRHLDPTLYVPYGPIVGLTNTIWQIVALCVVVFLLTRTLGWRREDALMIIALMLATADYTAWALVGLIAAGWMLPSALTIWAWSKGRYLLSGFTIAWAGLIKLFPFGLALPLCVGLARSYVEGGKGEDGRVMRDCFKALAACAISVVLLVVASSFVGKSWSEFFDKIVIQFLHANYVANGVGVTKIFHALGIAKSPLAVVPQLTVLFALCWVTWFRLGQGFQQYAPRLALIILSCLGWLTGTWFNYYAVIALFLLPGMLPERRKTVAAFIALYALSAFLPDYVDPLHPQHAWIAILKVLPHLALPLYALGREVVAVQALRVEPASPLTKKLFAWGERVMLIGSVLSALAISGDIYRIHTAIAYYDVAQRHHESGHLDAARSYYERSLRLLPANAQAHFNLATLLEAQGHRADAMARYTRALQLDADNVDANVNLAILRLESGASPSAVTLLERAMALMPYDGGIRINLANALLSVGDIATAREHFERALEIDPTRDAVRDTLQRLDVYEESQR